MEFSDFSEFSGFSGSNDGGLGLKAHALLNQHVFNLFVFKLKATPHAFLTYRSADIYSLAGHAPTLMNLCSIGCKTICCFIYCVECSV